MGQMAEILFFFENHNSFDFGSAHVQYWSPSLISWQYVGYRESTFTYL